MENKNKGMITTGIPEHQIRWLDKFYTHPIYGTYRFKKLDAGMPRFYMPENLIDIVSYEEFCRDDENRLPLFLGTQFGAYPRLRNMNDLHQNESLTAVLGRSVLSGRVDCLKIFCIKNDYQPEDDRTQLLTSQLFELACFWNNRGLI